MPYNGIPLAILDARYVNVIGDTMTGTLQIDVATASDEALILKTTDDDATDNLLETQDSGGNPFVTIDGEHQTLLVASAATKVPLTIKQAASQSGDHIQFLNSSGQTKAKFASNFGLFITPATQTSPAFSLSIVAPYSTSTTQAFTTFSCNPNLSYSASRAASLVGTKVLASKAGTVNVTASAFILGGIFESRTVNAAQGNFPKLTGGVFGIRHQQTTAGTLAIAIAAQFQIQAFNAANVITDSYGLLVITPSLLNSATITNNFGLFIEDQNVGQTVGDAICTNAGNIRFNIGGDADTDLIMAGDSEPNLFRVDAGTDSVRQGDWDTNYTQVDKAGDMIFVGGAGLPFGCFNGNNIAFTVAGGTGTFKEVFDGDITTGQLHNVTHNTTDENTLDIGTFAGMYLVNWSMALQADGGAGKHVEGAIGVDAGGGNGSLTANAAGRSHIETSGNNENSISGTAILDLSANSEVGVMVTNEDDDTNITVQHINLSIVMIGGT